MGAFSPWHVLLIIIVALLLFGPSKLPELGRGVGRMFKEFKEAANGKSQNDDDSKVEPVETIEEKPKKKKK